MPALSPVTLAPGETVILERRQALVIPALRSFLPFLEALATIAWFAATHGLPGPLGALARGLTLVLALAVLAHASLVWLWWFMRLYVVTDRRAIRREGLIARLQREAELEKAQNVSYVEGGLQKFVGLGHVLIETASTGKPIIFDDVTRAPEVTEIIMEQIEALRGRVAEQERAAISHRLRHEIGMRHPERSR